jgi:hypothetical protein
VTILKGEADLPATEYTWVANTVEIENGVSRERLVIKASNGLRPELRTLSAGLAIAPGCIPMCALDSICGVHQHVYALAAPGCDGRIIRQRF